jgi:hypothetical protein
MPRQSAASLEFAEFTPEGPRLAPPDHLNEQERALWHAIVDPFPPGRFDAGDVVLLIALVEHQARVRQINEQLDEMRHARLISRTRQGEKIRGLFASLCRMAREETRLIMSLATKLRLPHQTRTLRVLADAERARSPATMARPWDGADALVNPWNEKS